MPFFDVMLKQIFPFLLWRKIYRWFIESMCGTKYTESLYSVIEYTWNILLCKINSCFIESDIWVAFRLSVVFLTNCIVYRDLYNSWYTKPTYKDSSEKLTLHVCLKYFLNNVLVCSAYHFLPLERHSNTFALCNWCQDMFLSCTSSTSSPTSPIFEPQFSVWIGFCCSYNIQVSKLNCQFLNLLHLGTHRKRKQSAAGLLL